MHTICTCLQRMHVMQPVHRHRAIRAPMKCVWYMNTACHMSHGHMAHVAYCVSHVVGMTQVLSKCFETQPLAGAVQAGFLMIVISLCVMGFAHVWYMTACYMSGPCNLAINVGAV